MFEGYELVIYILGVLAFTVAAVLIKIHFERNHRRQIGERLRR